MFKSEERGGRREAGGGKGEVGGGRGKVEGGSGRGRGEGSTNLFHGYDSSCWPNTKIEHTIRKSKPRLVSGPVLRV